MGNLVSKKTIRQIKEIERGKTLLKLVDMKRFTRFNFLIKNVTN